MSEKEFLDTLTEVVDIEKAQTGHSVFIRIGHWDGGPAFIGAKDGKSSPICTVCAFLTEKFFLPQDWQKAAKEIGLESSLAENIQNACELSQHRDPNLYRRILIACGLPYSNEDNEDLSLDHLAKYNV